MITGAFSSSAVITAVLSPSSFDGSSVLAPIPIVLVLRS